MREDDVAIVELAALAVARERGLHDTLAQRAILAAKRAAAGRSCSAARTQTCLLCCSAFAAVGGGGDFIIGKTVQLFATYRPRSNRRFSPSARFAERGLQARQLRVHRLELGFISLGEFRARAHEILVIALQQIFRLGIQTEFVARVVEGLDPGERADCSNGSRPHAPRVSAQAQSQFSA